MAFLVRSCVAPALSRSATGLALPRRGLAKLRQDQIDAAIHEMNQEMADLFGEPMAEAAMGSSSTRDAFVEDVHQQASAYEPSPMSPADALTRSRVVPSEAANATAALYAHLSACTSELSQLSTDASDLERGLQLTRNMGEVARAIRALDDISR
mmetsp:Transcript_11114/g.28475  ORF Transcript_11114/g.28475 Transcript_11114/m.28475 type:complete len:154 (-) Transcript_11114:144-605(-)